MYRAWARRGSPVACASRPCRNPKRPARISLNCPVASSNPLPMPFVRAFSSDAMKRLMAAKWPGNVRQLVNVIEQCVALTSSPVIGDALVEQALEGENTALPTFVEARNQFELNYLRKLLQITKGNVTHAARMAGRNRTEFYKLLSRHELDANDFKE